MKFHRSIFISVLILGSLLPELRGLEAGFCKKAIGSLFLRDRYRWDSQKLDGYRELYLEARTQNQSNFAALNLLGAIHYGPKKKFLSFFARRGERDSFERLFSRLGFQDSEESDSQGEADTAQDSPQTSESEQAQRPEIDFGWDGPVSQVHRINALLRKASFEILDARGFKSFVIGMGPFGVILGGDLLWVRDREANIKRFLREIQEAYSTGLLAKHLNIPQDEFLLKSIQKVSEVLSTNEIKRLGRNNRVKMRLGVLVSGLVLSAFLNPIHALPLLKIFLDEPVYPATQMMLAAAQIDSRANPELKNVSFIMDQGMLMQTDLKRMGIASALTSSNGFLGEPNLVKGLAENFQTHTVSTEEELEQALESSSQADIRYIMGHGLPGRFYIAGMPISEHLKNFQPAAQKPGSVTIFISCLYGDCQLNDDLGSQESFVEVTNALYPDQSGLSFASTGILGMAWLPHISPQAATNWQSTLKNVGHEFLMNSTGLPQAKSIRNLFQFEIPASHFKGQAGFREYDTSRQEVDFYRVNGKAVLSLWEKKRMFDLNIILTDSTLSPEEKEQKISEWAKKYKSEFDPAGSFYEDSSRRVKLR